MDYVSQLGRSGSRNLTTKAPQRLRSIGKTDACSHSIICEPCDNVRNRVTGCKAKIPARIEVDALTSLRIRTLQPPARRTKADFYPLTVAAKKTGKRADSVKEVAIPPP